MANCLDLLLIVRLEWNHLLDVTKGDNCHISWVSICLVVRHGQNSLCEVASDEPLRESLSLEELDFAYPLPEPAPHDEVPKRATGSDSLVVPRPQLLIGGLDYVVVPGNLTELFLQSLRSILLDDLVIAHMPWNPVDARLGRIGHSSVVGHLSASVSSYSASSRPKVLITVHNNRL